MSKNIVIQEGGVGRQFTANKLTTALVGGGSCNWVPEDEIQLGTKYISENGTYIAANDGEYGYSQVSVNVNSPTKIITGSTDDGEPVVTTIDVVDGTISEIILGDYFIVTYDDGEVAKIEDNNGNRCLLTYDGETLSGFDDIEDNHYTIILDSNGNISQVIDPNAQDCELRDSDGDGKIDIISVGAVLEVVPDIETGDIKIIDENDNDVTDEYIGTIITGVDSDDTPWRANIVSDVDTGGANMGITPVKPAVTPGASISGTDSDGDDSVASINESGEIVQRKIPSTIEVVFPPTKTEYVDGETIDYTGIVARLRLKSGEIFTDENYPNGIIPMSELLFTVTKANIDEVSEPKYSDGNGIIAQQLNFDNPVTMYNGGQYVLCQVIGEVDDHGAINPAAWGLYHWTPRVGYATWYNDTLYVLQESDVFAPGTALAQLVNGVWSSIGYSSGSIKKTFSPGWPQLNSDKYITAVSTTNPDGKTMENKIEIGGTQTVPFAWANPYNRNNALTATFEISVTQSEESGGNPGGGDTSPVPEGITVQDINIAIYNATNAGQDHIEIDGQQYTLDETQAMIDYLISH